MAAVASDQAHSDDWHRSTKTKEEKFQKPFTFRAVGKLITIEQRPVVIENMNTLGYTVWDASLVLAKFLEKDSNFPAGFWKGKRAITLGAEVIATDIDVSLLSRNISSNVDDLSRTQVEELCWGNEQHLKKFENEPPFNYIVACDCIYFPDLIPLLIKTLVALASPSTLIIIASEGHFVKVLETFIQQAEVHFDIKKKVQNDEMDGQYRGSEFFIWYLTKKSEI